MNNEMTAPKIFIKPKTFGDIMYLVGEFFAWAVLLTFVTGLAFYFKDGYSSIASNKYLYFMNASKITAIVGGILLVLRLCLWGFTKNELMVYKSLMWTDIFVVAFGVFSVFSYLFSSFRTEDLGTNNIAEWFYQGPWYGLSGWYMGVLTYLIFIAMYFAISRCLVYNKLVFVIPVATVTIICLWGALNRYNVAPIDMNYDYAKEQAVFLASIGNINWFCGFTSVFIPLIWGLYMGAHKIVERILYIVCMAITFEMIILNSSDSGYVALAVTMLVLFGYAITDRDRFRRFLEICMCFFFVSASVYLQDVIFRSRTAEAGHWEKFLGAPSLAILIVLGIIYAFTYLCKNWNTKTLIVVRRIFYAVLAVAFVGFIVFGVVNTLRVQPIVENELLLFNGDWGSGRGRTWKLGIDTYIHMDFWHKLIGAGPDMFYYEMIRYDDLAIRVNDYYGGGRLTNAHNEIITLLANVGLFGTAAFVGIMVTSIKSSFKYAKTRPELICFALAIISYLANNMFSFEQITNIPFIFIVIGMEGAAIVVYDKAAVRLTKKDKKNKMQKGKKSRK